MTNEETAKILRLIAHAFKTSNLYFHSGPAVNVALEEKADELEKGKQVEKRPAPASAL